jgi:hypothetical protein
MYEYISSADTVSHSFMLDYIGNTMNFESLYCCVQFSVEDPYKK